MWITLSHRELTKSLKFLNIVADSWYIKLTAKDDLLTLESYNGLFYCKDEIHCSVIEEGEIKVGAEFITVVQRLKDKELMLKGSLAYLEISGLEKSINCNIQAYGFEYKDYSLSNEDWTEFSLDLHQIKSLFTIFPNVALVNNFAYVVDDPMLITAKTNFPYAAMFESATLKHIYQYIHTAISGKLSSKFIEVSSYPKVMRFPILDFPIDTYKQISKLYKVNSPTYLLNKEQIKQLIEGVSGVAQICSRKSDRLLVEYSKDSPNIIFIILDPKTKGSFKLPYESDLPAFKFITSARKLELTLKLLANATEAEFKAATGSPLVIVIDKQVGVFMNVINPEYVRY